MNEMNHSVRTYNAEKKCVYENFHRTAESAYAEYVDNIRTIKRFVRKGEQFTVVRTVDGQIMTIETIEG